MQSMNQQRANIRRPIVCRRLAAAWPVVMLLMAMSAVGCSRSFWRKQADREVYSLLPEKMTDPRWALPRFDVTPDPASRIFDPYPPDKGPLPPDDPAAHQYMHWVNGMRQSRSWHKFGHSLSIENPQWLEPFGLTPGQLDQIDGSNESMEQSTGGTTPPPQPDGGEEMESDDDDRPSANATVDGGCLLCDNVSPRHFGIEKLTLQQALELSYIHSRDYQTEIEDLYITALDLTFDRFRFNVRYLGLGGRKPTSDLTFETIPQGQNSLTANNRIGVSRLLPTGAQWIVELANNTVWLFAGPNQTNTASVLSYSLVQPLLLGAGRRVVLEGLTQRERDTLYAARDLGRFRKTFFADVVSGGPSRGFLGLLQQTQVIANRQNNIRQLEIQVERLRTEAAEERFLVFLPALPPGLQIPVDLLGTFGHHPEDQALYWRGAMTAEQEKTLKGLSDNPEFQAAVDNLIAEVHRQTITVEIAQLETRLANQRNTLRQSQRLLQDSLDQFKIQLGLPPDFYLDIDDSLLEQFALIDPQSFALEQRITEFVDVWAKLDEQDPAIQQLRRVADALQELQADVDKQGLQPIDNDFRNVDENMPQRLSRLATVDERETVRENVDQDRRLFSSLRQDYTDVKKELANLIESLKNDALNLEARLAARETLGNLRESLLQVVQSLQVIQAGLRGELISLQRFELGLEESVERGLANRLDLMNARARVVDARRREEVAANRLEAILDIVAEGDVRTPAGFGNPFDFRGRRSSFRVGARFTAPLDQIAERNDYRLALIDYQRARRDYMAGEDQVKFSIRRNWRQLRVLDENFENTRQVLRFAASQLDLVIARANAPAQQGGQQGRQEGLNLLNALNSVLNALNDLIGIWVDYERSRINIYRDMGMMDIAPRGVWTDPFYQPNLPLAPATPHDRPQQLGKPTILRHRHSGGPVLVRTGSSRGTTFAAGRRRGAAPTDDRAVPAPGPRFVLPRKIELSRGVDGGRAAVGR